MVSYNVQYFLEQCLLSLREAISSLDSEIIVVDNCSSDDSVQLVKEHFSKVILIENKINNGFASANNQGAEVATGEYICFLNPDTIVGHSTFTRLMRSAEQLPHLGIVGPKLISGTGDYLSESKRNIPSPLTSFRRLFGINLGYVKNYYADHISDNGIGDVDVLVGAFMMLKKKAFIQAGGFDDDYFMYGEDIDLSYKIKKNGLLNYYIGNIVAVHYRGESTDRNAVYVKRFYNAMRLFYKKHFRSNVILDVMVSTGIRIVSFFQSFKNFDKRNRKIDSYFLLSDNERFRGFLEVELQQKVVMFSVIKAEDLGDSNIEIIFDNDFMTFEDIIDQMQLLKKKNVTFKIRPKNCNYILGSNFSDGKGEVIVF
ncbi:glycosyltransferase family 2 protein [Aquimarina acroporae]|uniref:glycosyltransferase family 2 protein n=1 Tax=Aquimarina acroporae TaxID=2937283 RepID=UPI00293E1720|nr:glycosyltransferase family 2 protein [Aquimarina acroporae]